MRLAGKVGFTSAAVAGGDGCGRGYVGSPRSGGKRSSAEILLAVGRKAEAAIRAVWVVRQCSRVRWNVDV